MARRSKKAAGKGKVVKISSQMQVRIPSNLYAEYGFGKEALCVPTATGVEFRPVKSTADQSADIVEQLVAEGLTGEELVAAFRSRAVEEFGGEDEGASAGENA